MFWESKKSAGNIHGHDSRSRFRLEVTLRARQACSGVKEEFLVLHTYGTEQKEENMLNLKYRQDNPFLCTFHSPPPANGNAMIIMCTSSLGPTEMNDAR